MAVAAAGTVRLTATSSPGLSTQTAPLSVGKSSGASSSVLGSAQTQSATSAQNGANAISASHGLHASSPGSRTGGGAATRSGHGHEAREPGAERTSHGHVRQMGEKHAGGRVGPERHGNAPQSKGRSHGSTHGRSGKPMTHQPAGTGTHGGGTGASTRKQHAPATPAQGEGETVQPSSAGSGTSHVKSARSLPSPSYPPSTDK
jgi:hypothetical protein